MVVTKEQKKNTADVNRDEVIIQCAGLTKTFKDFWMRDKVRAVNGINLEVKRGEVFGLLGPNGSGKSTTIKMLLGLLSPSAGKISVFGKRPDDVAVKKNIGYLPEESFLYRFLNARETLDYYGRIFNLSADQRNKRTDMLLEMVGLENMQRRPVGEYSKGMQRRIGLAQALINDPQLLILDEPTTGMDPIGTRQIKDLIISLRNSGKTVLLCSHLLSDVQDVVDRVAIMYGGKICEYGTIQEMTTGADGSTISLERKFLEMVERERSKGTKTSGAQAGGKLAEFLGDSDLTPLESATLQATQVIDNLVSPKSQPTKPEPQPSAPIAASKTVDNSILDQLVESEIKPLDSASVEKNDAETTQSSSVPAAGTNLDFLDDLIVEDTPPAEVNVASAQMQTQPPAAEPEVEVAEEPVAESVVEPVSEPPAPEPVIETEANPVSMFEEAMNDVPDYEGDEAFDAPVETSKTNDEIKPKLKEATDESENPDQSFIDALTDVKPEDDNQQ